MRFGIDLPNSDEFADPALLVALAVDAEAAGWDGFFLWDQLVAESRSLVTDPWVVLSAVAAKTERVRLGPMVAPLARRRMNHLARETVALDHLSGGRLILGVGLGHAGETEFAAFGEPGDPTVRGRILDESLEVLSRLWSGEPVTYTGDYLHVRTAPFLPIPLQKPRIPVWVAGLWPNKPPMRRAARWDGAFPIDAGGDLTRQMSLEDMAEAIGFVKACRSGEGLPDFVHAGMMSGDAELDNEMVQRYADIGVSWWLEHFYPGRMSFSEVRALIRRGPPRTD
jgi:alkanesulfonate monooxygenase SsuD/methylene tetrahydromethanopterin reductase-like flavin-dependent oxidoreductase (luciferase family)